MKHYAFYDEVGRITLLGSRADTPPTEQLFIEIDAWSAVGNHYVDGGVLVAMPEQPSKYHVFDYIAKQWIDPRTTETQWPVVRAQRDSLLAECDWTQMPDVPLPNKTAWASYRQMLRDITQQTDPFNIIWPTRPV